LARWGFQIEDKNVPDFGKMFPIPARLFPILARLFPIPARFLAKIGNYSLIWQDGVFKSGIVLFGVIFGGQNIAKVFLEKRHFW
jgi:hypothetical protein